jgi:hypothetical protein
VAKFVFEVASTALNTVTYQKTELFITLTPPLMALSSLEQAYIVKGKLSKCLTKHYAMRTYEKVYTYRSMFP